MTEQGGDGPVAVIDLGSGAVKMLVVDRSWLSGGPALARVHSKTRLLPKTGDRISAEALAATDTAFEQFAEALAAHQATKVKVIGTAWARMVSNADELATLVTDRLGAELEIVDGQREAALGFAGATMGRAVSDPTLVVDIGAGSTEFALRPVDGPIETVSLPVGGAMVSSEYLTSDPPRPEELSSALSVVELYLDDLKREMPEVAKAMEAGTVIGTGAIGKIAEVEVGLPDPDAESIDGYRMQKVDVEEVFRALATESHAERAGNPGLRPHDVEDIVGAMCVLVEFMRQFDLEEVVVAEWGVSAGLAVELLGEG